VENLNEQLNQVQTEIAKVIVGQEETVTGVLLALLVGGHILLEGPPGVAKTLIAKTLARTCAAVYKRVQFTPDLMPLDLIGTNIFDLQKQEFRFYKGPIFTDFLLADEINRTPPKTQAALLEAMEEKQVTADGKLLPLSPVFTVIATQNPIEYEGTYPLPEAQLDRFLLKLTVTYPESEAEIRIYQRYQKGTGAESCLEAVQPVLTPTALLEMRQMIGAVNVREELFSYIRQIIQATRNHPLLTLGASPRGGIYLLLTAKAYAALQGRDYLIPDDLREVIYPVLRHRLLVKPEAQLNGKTSDSVLKNILAEVKVPR
jgi:MoxR-like ATPase